MKVKAAPSQIDSWVHRFREFPPHTLAVLLWASLGSLCLAVLVPLLFSLKSGGMIHSLDEAILRTLATTRGPLLNLLMVDFSSLGSLAMMIVFSVIAIIFLIVIRDPAAAIHLVITVVGGYKISIFTKDFFERPRPNLIPQLIKVSGFSFPSGHSVSSAALYITLAVLATRHTSSHKMRVTFFAVAIALISLVSLSRIYLGVHYPSDTLGGALFGSSWALFMAILFSKQYWGPKKNGG